MAMRGSQDSGKFGGVVDYVFGRNFMIGFAALMLLCISGFATWHGMSDFILGVQAGGAQPAADSRELVGLSVSTEALILVLVIALTFLMWLSLRESFRSYRQSMGRWVTLPLYLFLMLWSVGFGYGYWWSLIAGPQATQQGLRGQAEDVRDAAVGVAARLEAVKARLESVVSLSERQMAREDSSGGTCGVPSGAGRGPLYRARAGVRDSVDNLSANITTSWLGQVDADLAQLNAQLSDASAALTATDVAGRQAQYESAAAEIRGKARAIAARSDALGASFASEMRQLAAEVSVQPDETGFSCYDPGLANLLNEAATEAERPAEVELREAAFTEGAAGVAHAVLNLWTNFGEYLGGLWELATGDATTDDAEVSRTSEGDPITGRDLIALLASIGVDLGLFALTVLNPPTAAPAARTALDETLSRIAEPSSTAIAELSAAMRRAVAMANEDLDWVQRHFFSHHGFFYFVIPSLNSVDPDSQEGRCALAINQLSGVLSKLKIIQAVDRPERTRWNRWMRGAVKRMLERRFIEGLMGASTIVKTYRFGWGRSTELRQLDDREQAVEEKCDFFYRRWLGSVECRKYRPAFKEKATMALRVADWSENVARWGGDGIEDRKTWPDTFFLYHPQGFAPILTVLTQGAPAASKDRRGSEEVVDASHRLPPPEEEA